MNNKRLGSISLIRLIALIMIIICHILQGLGIGAAFWFNIGVQIFFFVSGFLYGKKEEKIKNPIKWYKKQITKILVPYIILCIVIILIDKFYFNISYGKEYLIGTLLGFQAFSGGLQSLSHTWFVSYILLCYLITPLLQNIFSSKWSEKQFVKYLFVGAIFLQLFQYFAVVNITIAWIYNYIIGYAFANYYIKNKINYSKFIKGFIILTIIVLIPRIVLDYQLFNITWPALVTKNTVLIDSWSHVLLGTSLFFILYTIFEKLHVKNYPIFKHTDKYSYYIYLVHQIFILKSMSILHLTDNLFINICCIFICSILFGIILYYLEKTICYIFIFFKKNIRI